MYDMAPSDQRSWFQIAGIHGKPYVEWNNAGPERSDGWRGYCPHGVNPSLVFELAHRTTSQ